MTQRSTIARTRLSALIGVAALLLPVTAANAGAAPTAPGQDAGPTQNAEPTQDDLKLNELQFLGSHNSYHLPPLKGLYDFAKTVAPAGLNPDQLLYEHAPLPDQFSAQGIRQIELDVSADPDGGRFASPAANILTNVPPYSDDYEAWNPPELDEPGTKVIHIPDFDMRTTCVLLTQCLTQIRDWSKAHPGHLPIAVLIEAKDEVIEGDFPIDLVAPLPYTADRLDALDAEIRTVFEENEIFTPDDLRGNADTLDEVVTGPGWPSMSVLRGQTMFLMDNGGAIAERYRDGHPALEGRVMFTSGTPGDPDAAFIKLNNPITQGADITDAVEAGYVVRTRADEPIDQAQSGDTTMQEAAFASGAQWVSTDYPVAGLTNLLDDYGLPFADYSAPLPPNEAPAALRSASLRNAEADGPDRVARCNPVSAPDYCYTLAITEPDPPTTPTTTVPGSPSDPDAPPGGSDPNSGGSDGSDPNGSDPNGSDSNGTDPSGDGAGGGGAATPLSPSFTG
ncbi:MAG: Ca2+-dependent phosphoinositide-specific phospholipase C [Microthrixaceae bacterium]